MKNLNDVRHELLNAYHSGIITYAELVNYCNEYGINLYYEITHTA